MDKSKINQKIAEQKKEPYEKPDFKKSDKLDKIGLGMPATADM